MPSDQTTRDKYFIRCRPPSAATLRDHIEQNLLYHGGGETGPFVAPLDVVKVWGESLRIGAGGDWSGVWACAADATAVWMASTGRSTIARRLPVWRTRAMQRAPRRAGAISSKCCWMDASSRRFSWAMASRRM